MDPVLATIALATAVKDVVELGKRLERSIAKVSDNKKRLRQLSSEIVTTLEDIQSLHTDNDVKKPETLNLALQRLRIDMERVLESCEALTPRHAGSRTSKAKAKLKAYFNRDEIEGKIGQLREHVRNCFMSFTAFSAARSESAAMRIEQALIVTTVESRAHRERVDVLMTKMLLRAPSGDETIQSLEFAFTTDSAVPSVEREYIRWQVTRLFDMLENFTITRQAGDIEIPDENASPFTLVYVEELGHEELVRSLLEAKIMIQESGDQATLHEGARLLDDLAAAMPSDMREESFTLHRWSSQLYRKLSARSPRFLPYYASSLTNVAREHFREGQDEQAGRLFEEVAPIWDILQTTATPHQFSMPYGDTLRAYGQYLARSEDHSRAAEVLQRACDEFKRMLDCLDADEDALYFVTDRSEQWVVHEYQKSLISLSGSLVALHRLTEAQDALRKSVELLGTTSSLSEFDFRDRLLIMLKAITDGGFLTYDIAEGMMYTVYSSDCDSEDRLKLYSSLWTQFRAVCDDQEEEQSQPSPLQDPPPIRPYSLPKSFHKHITSRCISMQEAFRPRCYAALYHPEKADTDLFPCLVAEYEQDTVFIFESLFKEFLEEFSEEQDWLRVRNLLDALYCLYPLFQKVGASKLCSSLVQLDDTLCGKALEFSMSLENPTGDHIMLASALRKGAYPCTHEYRYSRIRQYTDEAIRILRTCVGDVKGRIMALLLMRSDADLGVADGEQVQAGIQEAINLTKEVLPCGSPVNPRVCSEISITASHFFALWIKSVYLPDTAELTAVLNGFVLADYDGLNVNMSGGVSSLFIIFIFRAYTHRQYTVVLKMADLLLHYLGVVNDCYDPVSLCFLVKLMAGMSSSLKQTPEFIQLLRPAVALCEHYWLWNTTVAASSYTYHWLYSALPTSRLSHKSVSPATTAPQLKQFPSMEDIADLQADMQCHQLTIGMLEEIVEELGEVDPALRFNVLGSLYSIRRRMWLDCNYSEDAVLLVSIMRRLRFLQSDLEPEECDCIVEDWQIEEMEGEALEGEID